MTIDVLCLNDPCADDGAYPYDPHVRVLYSPGEESVFDVENPTSSEISNAIDTTDDYKLLAITGWEINQEIIVDPEWIVFDRQRIGRKSIDRAQLTYASDRQGNDVRQLWTRGEIGYVWILPSGHFNDQPMAPFNIYPVRVAGITQLQRLRTGEAAQLLVTFAVRRAPGENVMVIS